MRKRYPIVWVLLAFLVTPMTVVAAGHGTGAIPPGEGGAKAAGETSPCRHAWVDIAVPGREGKLSAFVAYPERREDAPVVIVSHEAYGLTDWVRVVADRLATSGKAWPPTIERPREYLEEKRGVDGNQTGQS